MTMTKVGGYAALSVQEQQVLREVVSSAEQSGDRVQTEWLLLTGAPGSGKTTMINCLANLGWRINKDPGRELLESDFASGISVDVARSDYRRFQERVAARMIDAMRALDPSTPVFFDYGVAESLAFLKASQLPWDKVFVELASEFKFRKVFLLEMVSLDEQAPNDLIRVEDNLRRKHLQQLIGEIYEALGHQVTFVPQMSLQERMSSIRIETGSLNCP